MGEDLSRIEGRGKYDQNIMYEVLKELIKEEERKKFREI